MATMIVNSFTTYELTEEEELHGTILTTAQEQVLQNKRAMIAEEKLALEFDPERPKDFIQQDAYKKGQLDLITYLLDASEAAKVAYASDSSSQSE